MHRRYERLSVLLFVLACSDGTTSAEQTHPTRENEPEPNVVSAHLSASDTPPTTGRDALHDFARSLRNAEQRFQIGAPEGQDGEIFGLVEDIVALENRRFAVLDSRFQEVRFYTFDGEMQETYGGEGAGPMEFRSPESMEAIDNRLAVLDRGAVIKFLEVADTGGWRYSGQATLDLAPEDMCVIGDEMFVQAVRLDGTIVHIFSATGEPQRSFGEPYRTEDPLVRNQLSDGLIACTPSVIATAPKYFGYAYGWEPETGSLKWVVEVDDFTPLTVISGSEAGRPFVRFEQPAHYDRIVGLLGVDDFVVVQVGRFARVPNQAPDLLAIETYVIDSATGEAAYAGSELPLVYAIREGLAFGATNDPFPQVTIHSLPRPNNTTTLLQRTR